MITISTGRNRKETRWKIQQTSWTALAKKLAETHRTSETLAEYMSATKERKAEIKDVGGFVGGAVEGGRRIRGSVQSRTLLTLDLDYAVPDVWGDITQMYACAMCLYSTHSHTPENPRYRLVVPLSRAVSPDEYEAVARRVADNIGIDMFDDSTYQCERLMYWPSTSKDGQYVYEKQEGAILDPDSILAEYHDWHDISQWPTSSRVDAVVTRQMTRKGEPTEKPGVIGAFCRAYGIEDAIATFLSEVYTQTDAADNRYTYVNGTSACGLVIYDDKFAFSHHATDPACGQLCNAFDLVRIHLFGAQDEGHDDTPVNRKPSYIEMERFAGNDRKTKLELGQAITNRLRDDFSLIEIDGGEEPNLEWTAELDRDKSGAVKSTATNICLILENEKGLANNIRRNAFAGKDEVLGHLPWRKVKYAEEREWRNEDDARLRVHLEKVYGITGKEKILACFTEVTMRHQYHPVRDYLLSLQWDGVERAETLLIDYLGAKDTQLVRSITRKFLAAACARIFEPGVKFDYVTVLSGRQGIGKSTLLAELAGQAWFNDSLQDLQSKDAMENLQGSWIIELGELQAVKRSEIESVKAFLSRCVDSFRPAYGRLRVEYPRQCIFFATTNEEYFLKGSDGNRRFWVVECSGNGVKDVFGIDTNTRNQIWAEAYQIYSNGEELHLDDENEKKMRSLQEEYNEETLDARLGLIEEYVNKRLPVDWNSRSINDRVIYLADEEAIERDGVYERNEFCIPELMLECFNERINENNRYRVKEYRNLLKRLPGWERAPSMKRFKAYGVQRYYVRKGEEENLLHP